MERITCLYLRLTSGEFDVVLLPHSSTLMHSVTYDLTTEPA